MLLMQCPTASILSDFQLMRRAIRLADTACGYTAPNPPVGCVIANAGEVIAEGATQSGGRPHAEAIALQIAGKQSRGATAYVTLEPCAHYGLTAPCSSALIEAGIARVVVAVGHDPDPRVAGAGIEQLRRAGIDVSVGCLADEAGAALAGFFKRQAKGMPYISARPAPFRSADKANSDSEQFVYRDLKDEVTVYDEFHSVVGNGNGPLRVNAAICDRVHNLVFNDCSRLLYDEDSGEKFSSVTQFLLALGSKGINRVGVQSGSWMYEQLVEADEVDYEYSAVS